MKSQIQSHSTGTIEAVKQPLDISEYMDYAAYASRINEDENKVSLPEGETPLNQPSPPKGDSALDAGNDPKTPSMHPAAPLLECHQTNTYHGPIGHAPNPPLNSPNPPSLSPHSDTYPPGQLPLPTFQPASMQVGGYPSQTPTMPHPAPTAVTANPPARVVIPRPSRRTKCIKCRHSGSKVSNRPRVLVELADGVQKRCDHYPNGRIDPVKAARPIKRRLARRSW